MNFDIDICILRYRSTFIEYRTRYRSTSISKLCTRYRRFFRNFDIQANTSMWYLKPTHFDIEVSLHYIEGTSNTLRYQTLEMLLRYRRSYFDIEVCFRALSNESLQLTRIFCVFQEHILCRQASIPFCW